MTEKTNFEYRIDAIYASVETDVADWTAPDTECRLVYEIKEKMRTTIKSMDCGTFVPLETNRTVLRIKFDNLEITSLFLMVKQI